MNEQKRTKTLDEKVQKNSLEYSGLTLTLNLTLALTLMTLTLTLTLTLQPTR